MSRVTALAKRALAIAALALVLVYLGDWLWIARQPDAAASETLTYWLATPLKNGKVEVFYDQPQTEICGRSLFPHSGRRPCWFARRQRIHPV